MGRLISYIYIYHLFECQHYITRFLSSSCQLEFSILEVKYDRFRNRDEGTWRKPLEILSTKRSLIQTSHVYHKSRAAGRNQQVEDYKHTHRHQSILSCLTTIFFFVNQKINNCIGKNDTSCLESLTC